MKKLLDQMSQPGTTRLTLILYSKYTHVITQASCPTDTTVRCTDMKKLLDQMSQPGTARLTSILYSKHMSLLKLVAQLTQQ